MDNILSEEEQISLLGKMLYYSANHLTQREREIYDQLIEHLLRKVNQIRKMEKRTSMAGDSSITEAQHQAKKNAIRNLGPEDVCRCFVDAWNKQDFETEYFCLARCFPVHKRKADNVHEYVLQRMKKYQDRHSVGPLYKQISEITSAQTHGNKTSVYCFENHKMPDKNLSLQRQYDLIFEDGAWRIADFETLKSHETARTAKKP
ncbi:MAG: hypothetical protein AB1656_11870 [Candidatus Omnitrophota bacterium]